MIVRCEYDVKEARYARCDGSVDFDIGVEELGTKRGEP